MSRERTERWVYSPETGGIQTVEIVGFQGAKTRVRLSDGTEIAVDTMRLSWPGRRRTR